MSGPFKSKFSKQEQKGYVYDYIDNKFSMDDICEKLKITKKTFRLWIRNHIGDKELYKMRVFGSLSDDQINEIRSTLESNALIHGFYTSKWRTIFVQKLFEEKYNMQISRHNAKILIKSSEKNIKDDVDRDIRDLEYLESKNYRIVLFDIIKIGELEAKKTNTSEFKKDVYLFLARCENRIYIYIEYMGIYTNLRFNNDFDKKLKNNQSEKLHIENGVNFINKVRKSEVDKGDIIFTTEYSKIIDRYKKNKDKPKFYIIDNYKNVNTEFRQDIYETDELKTIIEMVVCNDDNVRRFNDKEDISTFIKDKLQPYESRVEIIRINEFII